MRVLFASWAQTGHYQPLVPLGWALRAAGHEVAVLTNPSFVPTVASSGLTAVPVGPDINVTRELRERFAALSATRVTTPAAGAAEPERAGAHARDLPHNQMGRVTMSSVLEGCLAMLDDALAFAARWRPDLVLFEPTGFLGPAVATLRQLPSARVLWAPDYTVGMQAVTNRLFGAEFERFGLVDVDLTGTVTLDPCPPRMQVRDAVRRQPVRYIGYPGPLPPAPHALTVRGQRPRVGVTWGTTTHNLRLHDSYLAPDMLQALSTLDIDIVLAVGAAELPEFGELPKNVIHAGPVPLRDVLPACAAVVHQAGGGTMMTSVLAGLPQLVVPSLDDTTFNAECLAATGAGIHLKPGTDAAEILRCTALLLADPAYGEQARRLRAEAVAMPTPADVVRVLAGLTT
jgi:UDP:flavonoid glycosyltransferase YjiC (YdhE family)